MERSRLKCNAYVNPTPLFLSYTVNELYGQYCLSIFQSLKFKAKSGYSAIQEIGIIESICLSLFQFKMYIFLLMNDFIF